MLVIYQLGAKQVERIAADHPDVEFVHVAPGAEIPANLAADALLTFTGVGDQLTDLLRTGVSWVHSIGTGVDGFPFELLGDQVLTCSRGASAVPISEWCLAQMLAFEKRLPDSWISGPPEHWYFAELGSMSGKRLGLVGMGAIATEVARRALPFGMEVVAYRRRAIPSAVESVEVTQELNEALDADHVVVAAASTPATHGLIDSAALSAARPGLHLINVARGALIDEDALKAALDSGTIARASLDTVEPEPLPAGHWMYQHPGVRLSPHISWSGPGISDAQYGPFEDELERRLTGQPPLNVVDIENRY
jgi:phosphoglycerate dehydrogenase-like enzyme